MKKYILTSDSVISLEYVVRFVADPCGEVAVDCVDGIHARLVKDTYRGKDFCDRMKSLWLEFLENDENYFCAE